MTSDSDKPAPKPKRRPRRTQAEIFYEDYKREEAEWKAQLEAARLAAVEPPPPPPEKWKLPIHREYDEYGFPSVAEGPETAVGRPARTNQRLTP
jgi:hypothetical protein